MPGIIRKAQVAGRFYPSGPDEIHKLFSQIKEREKLKINYSLCGKNILGAVLPHAGHIFSGYQTMHFFEVLKRSEQVFDTWIIIHPLHNGGEISFAAEGSDMWNTPLGSVRIDKDFIDAMEIPVSIEMHRFEHSSEVILPFIQNYCENSFSFVSIGMARQDESNAREISAAIIKAAAFTNKKICLIASSDFSHYVSPESGKKMDQKVLDCILKKDVKGIFKEIRENDLSVCGYGPIMVLVDGLNQLHPDSIPEVLARGHSGEVHPSPTVVDYISIIFYN
jgi:AmmeMemoRadiSam system protein B